MQSSGSWALAGTVLLLVHAIFRFVGAGGYCSSVSLGNLQVCGCWRVLCFCESRQSSGSWVLAGTVTL